MAILKTYRADDKGNLTYQRAARNFNPLIAMATDYVVADEVDAIVAAREIDLELLMTKASWSNALILAGEK